MHDEDDLMACDYDKTPDKLKTATVGHTILTTATS